MVSFNIIVEVISTCFSLICLPINILFILLVLKERKRPPLSAPFFRLCIHLSIADVSMTIFSLIFFKFPLFGLFPQHAFHHTWAVVPIAGLNYLLNAQAIGIMFIAVNRFTAVYFPIRHKQSYWKPTATTITLLIQWITPIFLVAPLFFTEFAIVTDSDTGSVSFTARDPIVHKVCFLGMAVIDGIVINIIVGGLYFAIFVRVRSQVALRRPKDIVLRLALSAFIIFISYLALGIFSGLSALSPPTDAWMYRTLWFVAHDVLCSSNAPVLLAINRPIRQRFIQTYICQLVEISEPKELMDPICKSSSPFMGHSARV